MGVGGVLRAVVGLAVFAMSTATDSDADPVRPNCSFRLTKPVFADIAVLWPGQNRISYENVDRKIAQLEEWGEILRYKKKVGWKLKYNNGRAAYSKDDAIPVIKGPPSVGYVVTDGHHHVVASLEVGATRMPVVVEYDLSKLTVEEFWKQIETLRDSKGQPLVFWRRLDGTSPRPRRSFMRLEDDPNRYFVSAVARKVSQKTGEPSRGADYPVWIKVGDGTKYFEFIAGDVLRAAGLVFDPKRERDLAYFDDFVERARKVWCDHGFKEVRSICTRTHYRDIKGL